MPVFRVYIYCVKNSGIFDPQKNKFKKSEIFS